MGVNTVLQGIYGIVNGLIVPGTAGVLEAFIMPVDPRDDPPPAIYLWSSSGDESRESLPRSGVPGTPPSFSGWKEINHRVTAYLTWFQDNSDPAADVAFPSVVDVTMQALRSSTNPLYTNDPQTGAPSDLVDIGERMTYTLVPPRAVADQRYLRCDAQIIIPVLEVFQA